MYHKKAYADDISLREWNESRLKNADTSKRGNKAILKDESNSPMISSVLSRPAKKSVVDVAIEGIDKTTQVVKNMDNEKRSRKVIELMKQDKVLENLKSERHDLKEKILKLDDALIYPNENVSKEQLDMMRVQRSIMISYVGVLDFRISDLESKEA